MIRFCEKNIQKERASNGIFSAERIQVFTEMMDYIKNADKPKDSDKIKIMEVFEKHYITHVNSLSRTEKNIRYSFSKADERIILGKIIPLIKQEIGNNEDSFGEMEVGDFFEHFMCNLPDWWKKHQFSLHAISKHFKTIYMQIINNKNGDPNAKATVADVISDMNVDFSKMQEHG